MKYQGDEALVMSALQFTEGNKVPIQQVVSLTGLSEDRAMDALCELDVNGRIVTHEGGGELAVALSPEAAADLGLLEVGLVDGGTDEPPIYRFTPMNSNWGYNFFIQWTAEYMSAVMMPHPCRRCGRGVLPWDQHICAVCEANLSAPPIPPRHVRRAQAKMQPRASKKERRKVALKNS